MFEKFCITVPFTKPCRSIASICHVFNEVYGFDSASSMSPRFCFSSGDSRAKNLL